MTRPPDPQLPGFLKAYGPHIADLALALREIILEEVFCCIATSTGHINLGFPRGSTLPDPNRMLEGEGKTMRHIKFIVVKSRRG